MKIKLSTRDLLALMTGAAEMYVSLPTGGQGGVIKGVEQRNCANCNEKVWVHLEKFNALPNPQIICCVYCARQIGETKMSEVFRSIAA